MKIARYGLKVVYRKELILTMEDDVDSEELLKIFLKTHIYFCQVTDRRPVDFQCLADWDILFS